MPSPTLPGLTSTRGGVLDMPETVIVDTHRVWCDGPEGEGSAGLGHPRVYLEMGAAGFVECPYCDRRFVLAAHAGAEDERLDPGDYEGSAGR